MVEVLEDIRAFIAYRVQEGFEAAHEIVEDATNYVLGKYRRDDMRPEIVRITAELIAAHRAEQVGWESPTDCDRLDEAFEALNR